MVKHAEKPPRQTLPDNGAVRYRPNPTDFYHTEYKDWEQYPQGVADMVGYWAEFELFGGVVIFDRGQSGVEVGSVHMTSRFKYLHSRFSVKTPPSIL